METQFDVCIIGGSIGGVLAAHSLAKEGKHVLLTESTDWIGGQLTSQAVPPDEHKWIEEFGCTKSYRDFRNNIRNFYKKNYPVFEEELENDKFLVKNSTVSRIAHEPLVALHLLNEMLLPFISNKNLTIMLNTKVVNANVKNDNIESVIVKSVDNEEEILITAKYFIDATDTGELLPIAKVEYVIGAESNEETGEPNAPKQANPYDMQPITWVGAVDFCQGENHVIEKPKMYDYFNDIYQTFDIYKVFSWYGPDSNTGKAKKFSMFNPGSENLFPLWDYRRIVFPKYFKNNFHKTEVTLINWPQNDYIFGNIFEDDNCEEHLESAKQFTLSFIYWLQTEAPREDGGFGYPEIRLRGDVLGTKDGLAKSPYIRESRRIKAKYTITEKDINAELRTCLKTHYDSVGVGCYHIDLHPTTKTHSFMYKNSYPFEIPLGAMIPIRVKNLIAGCKNIGTTHLTNGCYRLHPVEWNIGEVAGYLASMAIDINKLPCDIRENEELLKALTNKLENEGIQLHWDEKKVHVI